MMLMSRASRTGSGSETTSVMPAGADVRAGELGPGALVGSYVVESLASRGGFAAVYRGRHVATGQPAALKVLDPLWAASRHMLQRFRQEAETVNRLRHPHIVTIYELDELIDGRPFIAMEWLEGGTLEDELTSRGTFAMDEAMVVLEELGSAVAAAHAIGVIHRDIKAANIMAPRTSTLTIKLVDFGIAKLTAPEDIHVTVTSRAIIGTPRTMAPEQILGEPVDARTDIYAMAVLLFQLVTGRLPFDGSDAVEIEQMHLSAPRPRASELSPVPPALDAVIQRALDVDKERRYPSVDAFLVALRQAVAGTQPGTQRAANLGRGLGLRISIQAVDVAGMDEPAWDDALDRAMDLARQALGQAGLVLAVETMDTLLAVLPDADAPHLRRAVLTAARGLARDLGRLLPPGVVAARLVLCMGALALTRTTAGAGTMQGELVRLASWPEPGARPGLYATDEVLDGLGEADSAWAPVAPGLYRMVSRVVSNAMPS